MLLAELRNVLGRKHLDSRLAAQRSSVEQAIGFYGELGDQRFATLNTARRAG